MSPTRGRCFAAIIAAVVLCSSPVLHAIEHEDTVLQVHVAFRHGDRTPDENDFYPNDPYKDMDFYPLAKGDLTNSGKERVYQLGKFLRARYNHFLGDLYDPQIVEASSTDFDRTKMSLELMLAGLFPPNPLQQWSTELLWLPIPYSYKPHKEDTFLKRPNDYCPVYYKELQSILKREGSLIMKNNSETIQYTQRESGKPLNALIDVLFIYQTLLAEENMNLTLPDWTKPVYPEPLGSIAAQQCALESGNTLLKKLNGGNILRKYLTNAKARINGTLKPKGRKIYLYSGHETNALNVPAALGVYNQQVPMYGDAHIFELVYRNSTEQYGFKFFYHDQRKNATELLQVPGCDTFCPYEQFIAITEPVIPKNYTSECGSEVNIDDFP